MPLRCLIVDDSADFVSAARGLLERQGMSVVGVASTSAEAVATAHDVRPDVALVDVDLGDESGVDLVWRLSGEAGLEEMPSVLISIYAESDFADVVASSPAVGFLTKSALSAGAIRGLVSASARRGT
jgi:two-component system, NarL family, nitrate/nitrite response regulator NarL